MTNPEAASLPADVQALLDDMKRREKRNPDLALTDADLAILQGLYHGQTLQAIGDALGLKKQSVHRRQGLIRDTLQLYFLSAEMDGEEMQAYKDLYEKIRGKP